MQVGRIDNSNVGQYIDRVEDELDALSSDSLFQEGWGVAQDALGQASSAWWDDMKFLVDKTWRAIGQLDRDEALASAAFGTANLVFGPASIHSAAMNIITPQRDAKHLGQLGGLLKQLEAQPDLADQLAMSVPASKWQGMLEALRWPKDKDAPQLAHRLASVLPVQYLVEMSEEQSTRWVVFEAVGQLNDANKQGEFVAALLKKVSLGSGSPEQAALNASAAAHAYCALSSVEHAQLGAVLSALRRQIGDQPLIEAAVSTNNRMLIEVLSKAPFERLGDSFREELAFALQNQQMAFQP